MTELRMKNLHEDCVLLQSSKEMCKQGCILARTGKDMSVHYMVYMNAQVILAGLRTRNLFLDFHE